MSGGERASWQRMAVVSGAASPPAGTYSPGICWGGLVFVSGQGPFDPEGRLVGEDFVEQARAAFANVDAIARAAGGSLQSALRIGVYLRSLDNFAALNEVMRELLTPPYPARTTIPAELPGFEIEVDAIVALEQPD